MIRIPISRVRVQRFRQSNRSVTIGPFLHFQERPWFRTATAAACLVALGDGPPAKVHPAYIPRLGRWPLVNPGAVSVPRCDAQ